MTKRKRETSLEDLPSDVLMHIFSYLTPPNLLIIIERVNKLFQSLLLNQTFWKNVEIKHATDLHPSFFKKYGHLISSLTLEYSYTLCKTSCKDVNYFLSLNNLKSLNLLQSPFVRLDLLESYLEKCSSTNLTLKKLFLPKMLIVSNKHKFTNNIFLKIAKLKLRTLSMSFHKSFFQHDYSLYIWSLLTHILKKHIRNIQFYNFPIADSEFLITLAKEFKHLKTVNLDLCQLSTRHLNLFMSNLGKNITAFEAKFIEFNTETMRLLTEKKKLKQLGMCHRMHSNTEYNFLSLMKKLESIDIVSGSVFDYRILEKCKNLKSVTILRTRINNTTLFWNFVLDKKNIKFILSKYIVFDIINSNRHNQVPSNVCLV